MDPAAWNRTHYEDTAMRYFTYLFFDTLFVLIASDKFYSLSAPNMKTWDKVEYVQTGKWFYIRVQNNSSCSGFFSKIARPSTPAPEDPMDRDYMEAV